MDWEFGKTTGDPGGLFAIVGHRELRTTLLNLVRTVAGTVVSLVRRKGHEAGSVEAFAVAR